MSMNRLSLADMDAAAYRANRREVVARVLQFLR
jgi:hypothetical protein